jgi:NTE family protein
MSNLLKPNVIRQACALFTCLLLSALASCTSPIPPQVNVPAQEPPATRLAHIHPQVILVLGSGGARGFSHVGVLKALQRNHIPIDMIVGTSAGSIVGALYADQPSAERVRRLLLEAKRDQVIDFSIFNIASGPIQGTGLQKFLSANMRAKTFSQLQIPFAAVATNFETGELHVFGSGPVPPAVNASAAAPPFFRPVKIYGRIYADGGLVDPVAVDVAQRYHPKIIIAVRLDSELSKNMPTYSSGFFLRGFDMMLLKLSFYSAREANIVIVPEVGDINMFADQGRADLMAAGELATERKIAEIKKLLAKNNIPLRR